MTRNGTSFSRREQEPNKIFTETEQTRYQDLSLVWAGSLSQLSRARGA